MIFLTLWPKIRYDRYLSFCSHEKSICIWMIINFIVCIQCFTTFKIALLNKSQSKYSALLNFYKNLCRWTFYFLRGNLKCVNRWSIKNFLATQKVIFITTSEFNTCMTYIKIRIDTERKQKENMLQKILLYICFVSFSMISNSQFIKCYIII